MRGDRRRRRDFVWSNRSKPVIISSLPRSLLSVPGRWSSLPPPLGSSFPTFPSVSLTPVLSFSLFLLQATDNGSFECTDSCAVPAVCSSAIPKQPRATSGPHPPTSGAALPAVHATALPGPAGPAAGVICDHRLPKAFFNILFAPNTTFDLSFTLSWSLSFGSRLLCRSSSSRLT